VKAAGEGSSSGSDVGGRLTPCPRRCKKLRAGLEAAHSNL
jgi:hypothetical protein